MRTLNLGMLVVVLVFVASGAVFGLEYEIIDLGTLGGSESTAYGINEYGQIVGGAETASSQTRAFIWEDGVMSDLGTLGGNMSEAFGLNDNGQIVGRSVNASGRTHAFLREDSVMYDLGTLGGTESKAQAINNAGQIVGSSKISSGYWRAMIYESGVMSQLPKFAGTESWASAINSSGQSVGGCNVSGGSPWHACLWENNTIIDLGTLPGTSKSSATGINDDGQIVGQSNNYPSLPRSGFIYEGGVMSGIGSLGQSPDDTRPRSINNHGQIVGYSHTVAGDKRAFVYEDGVMTDLGTLGGSASEAWGINDAGWIVGCAEMTDGDIHAVLWTPSLIDTAIFRIMSAIGQKQEALATIDAAIETESQAYDALEELLGSGDYEDLSRQDIAASQREIESAIRRQSRSKRVLTESIERLEDALLSLGFEPVPEPNVPVPEPNFPVPTVGRGHSERPF